MASRGPRKWPVERREHEDPVSGVRVTQLTDYRGHSHHLYFTNPGWYDGGRRLLFGSDRENRANLFGVDLETGEIEQLTDFEPDGGKRPRLGLLRTSVNPARDECYFWYGREMTALDLATLELRTIGVMPEGFVGSMLNTTADGKWVCTSVSEDLSGRFRIDLGRGYVGFNETFEAHPLSRVVRYSVDGSRAGPEGEVLYEERCWLGHVNTSPTRPELLTFCHEGPWHLVDNRIWCMDMDAGTDARKVWKVRPRDEEGERIGHEYWYADGERIGYHGAHPPSAEHPDGRGFLGHVRYDDTGRVEESFPGATGHIHSNDEKLIAGDASPYVRLWKWTGERYEGPRVLARHRSSFHIQKVHVHPRFDPAGRRVVYTSDTTGYGNVYMVEVPEFDALPPVER